MNRYNKLELKYNELLLELIEERGKNKRFAKEFNKQTDIHLAEILEQKGQYEGKIQKLKQWYKKRLTKQINKAQETINAKLNEKLVKQTEIYGDKVQKTLDAMSGATDQMLGKDKLYQVKPMYDMPSNFDLKGLDIMNDVLDNVTHYMTDQMDEIILKAIKEDHRYIVTLSEYNHFDKEKGVYSFKKTMYSTNDRPNEYDMSAIDLKPVLDKFKKLDIDYMNMTKEEILKVLKENL